MLNLEANGRFPFLHELNDIEEESRKNKGINVVLSLESSLERIPLNFGIC